MARKIGLNTTMSWHGNLATSAILLASSVVPVRGEAPAQMVSAGSNSWAITDVGSLNQAAASNATAGNERNHISIEQLADSNGSRISVLQLGNDNRFSASDRGRNNSINGAQGTAALVSSFNRVSVVQDAGSFDNMISVAQFDGHQAAPNSVNVAQAGSLNTSDISVRGRGNSADVQQSGSGQMAQLSMIGGDLPLGDVSKGNRIALTQAGLNHRALFSLGKANEASGIGNEAVVAQSGSDHLVHVWQTGSFDKLVITQADPTDSPNRSSGFRAVADVSQRSERSSVELKQSGPSYAVISQGHASDSRILVVQSQPANTSDDAGPDLVISQSGRNKIDVVQVGSGVGARIWQKKGSELNEVLLRQGSVGPSSVLFADVVQAGAHNKLTIQQEGTGQEAYVTQLGNGEAAQLSNDVLVQQSGGSNGVRVVQSAEVGFSTNSDSSQLGTGEPYSGAIGRRGSQVAVIQTGVLGWVSVEQNGKGQQARIEQGGFNNSAVVLQSRSAANASIYIIQFGQDNSYSITQDRAGEYVRVTQMGNGNATTDVVRRPD